MVQKITKVPLTIKKKAGPWSHEWSFSNNAMLSSLEVHMFVTDWNSGTVIFLMIKSTHGISNNIIYQFLQIENQMCWTHRARDVVYRCCPRYQSPRKTAPVDQWQSTPLATWTSGWRIGGMCFRWLKWSSKGLDMEILSKDVLGYISFLST